MAPEANLSCIATVCMDGLAHDWRSMAMKILQKDKKTKADVK